jgi:uncharacterized protein YoaH (UPF0181 family)
MAKHTKEEQQKAIDEIVKLLNEYELSIMTEQLIKIVPSIREESSHE